MRPQPGRKRAGSASPRAPPPPANGERARWQTFRARRLFAAAGGGESLHPPFRGRESFVSKNNRHKFPGRPPSCPGRPAGREEVNLDKCEVRPGAVTLIEPFSPAAAAATLSEFNNVFSSFSPPPAAAIALLSSTVVNPFAAAATRAPVVFPFHDGRPRCERKRFAVKRDLFHVNSRFDTTPTADGAPGRKRD